MRGSELVQVRAVPVFRFDWCQMFSCTTDWWPLLRPSTLRSPYVFIAWSLSKLSTGRGLFFLMFWDVAACTTSLPTFRPNELYPFSDSKRQAEQAFGFIRAVTSHKAVPTECQVMAQTVVLFGTCFVPIATRAQFYLFVPFLSVSRQIPGQWIFVLLSVNVTHSLLKFY
jgi:hypothetical protein